MKGKIYKINGDYIKDIDINGDIFVIGESSICEVCEDISDYIGYVLVIPDLYIGYITEYVSQPTYKQITLKNILYHLQSVLFSDRTYNNKDISEILSDIIYDYKNIHTNSFIDSGAINNTGNTLSVNIRGKSCLEVFSGLHNYINNGYVIQNYVSGNKTYINLLQDTPITINNTDISEIGYSSIGGIIINKITVTNGNGISVTKQDSTSISKYGVYEKMLFDPTIKDTTTANNKADAILQQYSTPKKIINYIKVTHDVALDNNLTTINKLINIDGNEYYVNGYSINKNYIIVYLSDKPYSFNLINENVLFDIYKHAVESASFNETNPDKAVDVKFTAVDADTIQWTSGYIYTSDGNSYSVASGSYNLTTNDIYYIYYDKNTNNIVFTPNASDAVGADKMLIGGAKKASDPNKLAEFTIFGTDNKNVLIGRGNILADSIGANEIAANSITASHIQSNSITASHIQSGAITTNKIAVGAVDNSKVSFNYAGSNTKGGNAIDTDNVAGTSATTVRDGANRAYQGLDSSGLYRKWLRNSQLQSGSNPYNGVIFDSNGIRGYKSGTKTFEIDTNGNAFFRGTIGASKIESDGYILLGDTSNDAIKLDPSGPKIKIYNEGLNVGDIGPGGIFGLSGIGINGDLSIQHGWSLYCNSIEDLALGNYFTLDKNGLYLKSNADLYLENSSNHIKIGISGGEMHLYATNSGYLFTYKTSDGTGGTIPRYRGEYSTPPSYAIKGDMYYNTSTSKMYIYNGSTWLNF